MMKACPAAVAPSYAAPTSSAEQPPSAECDKEFVAGSKYQKIGLLDHMGWGNLGDAAIQEAFIANIRRRLPDASLVAFSLYPEDTQTRHGLLTYPIVWCYPGWDGENTSTASAAESQASLGLKAAVKRFRWIYAWAKPVHDFIREFVHLIRSYKVVSSLDLLVVSGGGQLCELWWGPWSHPYNVFKFCFLAKLARTPIFVVGVGAGPLDHGLSKFFARWAVRLADYVSFRDIESQRLVDSLGIDKATLVCPDPAYALDIKADAIRRPDANALPTVGINPIGFCDPRIWPRHDSSVYQRYLEELTSFVSWLLAHGYRVEIFTNETSVDRYAIHDLKLRLEARGGSGVSYRTVLTVDDVLQQMAGFEYVVTSKFHGVIFSHLLQKPVVALSYHPKIRDLMQAVGHNEYCLDIETCKAEDLVAAFSSLVENRAALRERFRQKTLSYGAALQQQFDNLFVPGLQP